MTDIAATLAADGLRVVFFKQGDRYAHRIEVLDDTGQNWGAVLESLEGTPDDDWPPSPPFQQLHVEERPTGPVVLLIGMAGRTHWSAAVQTRRPNPTWIEIQFEVAARIQIAASDVTEKHTRFGLGSCYRPLIDSSYEWVDFWPTGNSVHTTHAERFYRVPTRSITPRLYQITDEPPLTVTWQYEMHSKYQSCGTTIDRDEA